MVSIGKEREAVCTYGTEGERINWTAEESVRQARKKPQTIEHRQQIKDEQRINFRLLSEFQFYC